MTTSMLSYNTLGRSGLVVSPLTLGTMTFGASRWGVQKEAAESILSAYVEAGGNFLDTADVYSGGRCEEMLGAFISERNLRDQIVIATKAGFASGAGPMRGGNGAKYLHHALEGSLRRLQTDYVDLFWIHVWDSVTPAEELLETMTTLCRAGKFRYWGMSNAPAWYVAKLATLAAARNVPGPIAMQYFYSLVNRDIEDEHVPLAAEFGMGILPWSPLAYGLLTGKYDRKSVEARAPNASGLPRGAAEPGETRPEDDKRLDGANPFGDTLFTERNWQIVEGLRNIANDVGSSMARVALAWVSQKVGVASTIIGVSRVEQVADNVAALSVTLSDKHVAALDALSAQREPRMIYTLLSPQLRQHVVFGGSVVSRRP